MDDETTYKAQVRGWTAPETFELLELYVDKRPHSREPSERFWKWVLNRIDHFDRKAKAAPYLIEEIAGRYDKTDQLTDHGRVFAKAFARLWRESLERTGQADQEHKAPPAVDDAGQAALF